MWALQKIEMPFRMWTWVSWMNHVLDTGPDLHTWRQFWGQKGSGSGHVQRSLLSKRLNWGKHRYSADSDLDVLDSDACWQIRLNRLCAAAMRPYVKLLWPLVSVAITIAYTVLMILFHVWLTAFAEVSAASLIVNCKSYVFKLSLKLCGDDRHSSLSKL